MLAGGAGQRTGRRARPEECVRRAGRGRGPGRCGPGGTYLFGCGVVRR